ncbi:glycoside hydrolase family 16 protein [Armillaria mellea]|nr:glycoside hydrolase family 16 protein [Armillaria mellea]
MIWPGNSCLRLLLLFYILFSCQLGSAYDIVRDYSGSTFFDRWDFFGNWDNLTLGDVWWLSKADAFAQGLTYVNSAGNAIMKVDNMHNVVNGQKRNSVRITSQDIYDVGSLWIIDLKHIPFGCSVWPAFWTKGYQDNWPVGGEIDIIEAINLMPNNQMALHTTSGCSHVPEAQQYQSGATTQTDCSLSSGCTVLELKENSLYTGLAEAGGGVWATQFDVSGIWFWSRPNVPASISATTSSTGNLVLDITLCGQWAGLSNLYFPSCGSGTGTCYADSVVGPGSNFNDAYFEISYIRAYTTGAPAPTPNALVSISTSAPTALPTSLLAPSKPTASSLFFPGSAEGRQANMMGAIAAILMVGFFNLCL